MKILTEAIVSNSDIFKDYKKCREKAETFGKTFILKNNQPDAVLFSINEYSKFATLIEYLENLEEDEIEILLNEIPKIIPSEVEADSISVYK